MTQKGRALSPLAVALSLQFCAKIVLSFQSIALDCGKIALAQKNQQNPFRMQLPGLNPP